MAWSNSIPGHFACFPTGQIVLYQLFKGFKHGRKSEQETEANEDKDGGENLVETHFFVFPTRRETSILPLDLTHPGKQGDELSHRPAPAHYSIWRPYQSRASACRPAQATASPQLQAWRVATQAQAPAG